MGKKMTGGHPDLKMVNPGAAAIDIGSTIHMAAVTPTARTRPSARSAPSRATCMIWPTAFESAA